MAPATALIPAHAAVCLTTTFLAVLDIRVIDGSRVEHRYDPNGALIAGLGSEVRHRPPDPSKSSVISGTSDCLTYRSVDLSFGLTPQEMYRFIRHALRPTDTGIWARGSDCSFKFTKTSIVHTTTGPSNL